MPTSSQATSRFYFDSQAHNHNRKGDDAQAPSPFSSADFDAKTTKPKPVIALPKARNEKRITPNGIAETLA